MSEYNYNENYFETIDSEHKAYWLGFLYADGYVEPIYRKEKIKAFRIEVGLSLIDKEHLTNFITDLDSNVPISERKQNVNGNTYETCRVRINNTKMCRDLILHGCTTRKSLTLTFPKAIPNELLRHFVRGYFDGDGCIHYSEREYMDKRNNKQYTQKSIISSIVGTESFLNSLMHILSGLNINFKMLKTSNCGKASEIRLYRHEELSMFYDFMYKDATVFLFRKKDKFIDAFNKLNIKIPATFQ